MTYAQLTVIADAARKSVSDLLYQGYTDDGAVDLEVGFERERADAAGQLAYVAAIKAGEEFVWEDCYIGQGFVWWPSESPYDPS